MRRKQVEATNIFAAIKNDPSRYPGTDTELLQANKEASQLAKELALLRKKMGKG